MADHNRASAHHAVPVQRILTAVTVEVRLHTYSNPTQVVARPPGG